MQQKYLSVTIIGTTNSGKSTLINNLVKNKVSIVTPKAQTTRVSMKAILILRNNTQVVFVDTPGIFQAKTELEKSLTKEAWKSIKSSDLLLLLVDAKNYLSEFVKNIIEKFKKFKTNAILVLNKIDLISEEQQGKICQYIGDMYNFQKIVKISALHSIGIDILENYFFDVAYVSPWMYPEEMLTDAPMDFFMAEITREKLFLYLRQELPYSIAVKTDKVKESDKDIVIHQTVYVAKENHKSIVIGANAQIIKKVSIESRKELEEILGKPIHLYLFVKLRESWLKTPGKYIGYA